MRQSKTIPYITRQYTIRRCLIRRDKIGHSKARQYKYHIGQDQARQHNIIQDKAIYATIMQYKTTSDNIR